MCCFSALSSETMEPPVRGKAGQRAHATVCSPLLAYCGRGSHSTCFTHTPLKHKTCLGKDTVFQNDVMARIIKQCRKNINWSYFGNQVIISITFQAKTMLSRREDLLLKLNIFGFGLVQQSKTF